MIIPDNILSKMSKEERAKLGKAGVLASEAQAVIDSKSERTLQNQIAALLNQRNIFFISSRFGKRTRNRPGTPDFLITLPTGMTLAVECKTATGKLSDEQVKMHIEYFCKTGSAVEVVRSLESFIKMLDLRCLIPSHPPFKPTL